MSVVSYHCKFCLKPGSVEYDPGVVSEHFNLEWWTKLLACNRCADFERVRRDTESRIFRACQELLTVRQPWIEMPTRTRIEDAMRKRLRKHTEQFARMVCNYYRQPITWDSEFVEILMDTPGKCWFVLSDYRARAVKAGQPEQPAFANAL